MAGRRKCRITGCGEAIYGHTLCEGHWEALPEDLRYRIDWAQEEGTTIERAAALRAASEYLKES